MSLWIVSAWRLYFEKQMKKGGLQIDKEDIGRCNRFFIGTITELNDRRIVVRRNMKLFHAFLMHLCFLVATCILIACETVTIIMIPNQPFVIIVLSIVYLYMIVIVAVCWLKIFVRNKQYVIFDRKQRTVTFPANALSRKPVTVNYTKKDSCLWIFFPNITAPAMAAP